MAEKLSKNAREMAGLSLILRALVRREPGHVLTISAAEVDAPCGEMTAESDGASVTLRIEGQEALEERRRAAEIKQLESAVEQARKRIEKLMAQQPAKRIVTLSEVH